jgi:trehalose synthase
MPPVASLTSVPIAALPIERFASILPPHMTDRLLEAAERSRAVLADRVVWNINSTAAGGGVAEMLFSLLAYAHGVGVDARWEVISGNSAFFSVTKRIHNNLHSAAGDGGALGEAEREIYEAALAPNIDELVGRVRSKDVVIVHDPQPAGLIPALKRAVGVPVIWRCHVGVDTPTELARRAWRFITPYVEHADAYVFSRRVFAWEGLDQTKTELIAPVIDAFSAKNQELDGLKVRAILGVVGLDGQGQRGDPVFTRVDGTVGRVERTADIVEGRPLRVDDRVVLQVSRWDRLKDPTGVIRGFIEHVAPTTDAHLVYAGPAVAAVSDDPEGRAVLDEVHHLYDRLPAALQSRLHLACLPMDDVEENAAMVNALQRRADVVVQKSIAEGFGLTVAEAMWKARPVVASRIGGIQDQIADGVSGVLLDDPRDLHAYGLAVRGLLQDVDRSTRLGLEARERVRDEFLAARSLMQYLNLIQRLLT